MTDTRRFLCFAVTGGVNAAVDMAVFALILTLTAASPFAANLVAFGAAVLCSFVLNRVWAFGDRWHAPPVLFVMWMVAVALLSSWILAQMVAAGVHVIVAKVVVTALVLGVNFQVMNKLVFQSARRRMAWAGGAVTLGLAAALNLVLPAKAQPQPMTPDMRALYDTPAPPPAGPRRVYHLGHSLVGRDMPAMLAQLAGPGHSHGVQLGWGTSINQHLTGQVAGFAVENRTPAFHPLEQALADTTYDAFVFTEMIALEAAVLYHDSAGAVGRLVSAVRAGNPDVALYLYETWHPLNEGDWLNRFATDWATLWEPSLLVPAIRAAGGPVHVIPAGTAMARLVAQVESTPGGVGGMTRREDLFALAADGTQDMIHLNDLGAYFVALVHYAVLYGQSPEGLPQSLLRADGSAATPPSPELAALMQRVAWQTVRDLPLTGVPPG